MNTPTYEQQWQKITEAYSNNLLNPFNSCACFIGNLLNGKDDWRQASDCNGNSKNKYANEFEHQQACIFIQEESNGVYTSIDIAKMEANFLSIIDRSTYPSENSSSLSYVAGRPNWKHAHPNYENALYEAMVSTLSMLKKIHASKGDITAIEIPLQKRQLNQVI